eukprot:TRINITY_DN11360_c0_g1_i5.p1 TRINITY_DN11360_c0_g1~~TRINITY_DN11360_c0_g1_i5.p1  ORF type:complete len:106 (+),score=5.45 TRINITY_DN11360_c0_g1_i5:72-389(+)
MCPKLLKCASNDDMITVKAVDDADTVIFIFESPRPVVVEEDVAEGCSFFLAENKRRYLTERKILNGISFVISAGSSVAIVGTSGSGKASMILKYILDKYYIKKLP